MTMTVSIGPVIALVAGILILVMPRLLNFIVAIYLILIGLLGLFGGSHGIHISEFRLKRRAVTRRRRDPGSRSTP